MKNQLHKVKLPRGYGLRYAITSPGVVSYRIIHEGKGHEYGACELPLFLCREGEGREADVRGQAFILPDLPWAVKDAAIKALAAIQAPVEPRGVTVCDAMGKRFIPA